MKSVLRTRLPLCAGILVRGRRRCRSVEVVQSHGCAGSQGATSNIRRELTHR